MLYMITSNGFFFINKCTLLTYGFVPDIMIILQKYKLVEYIDNFSKTSLFPSKKYGIRMLQWNVRSKYLKSQKLTNDSIFDK